MGNSETAFNQADLLWRAMQNSFKNFIEDNNGELITSNPFGEEIKRPNWEAIRNQLISSTPITSVPCN
jgi:hypothetical protein